MLDHETFEIIQWVIIRDQIFTKVGKSLTRDIFDAVHSSSKALALSLVTIVEDSARCKLQDNACLKLDEYSKNHVCYVAVLYTYTKNNTHHKIYVACAPVLKEDILWANQYFSFLFASLVAYGQELRDII